MPNNESTKATLLQYINYAALAQYYFKTFSYPINVSSWNIPPCECSSLVVRNCFPFVSPAVLDAADCAIKYTTCLREYARHWSLIYPHMSPIIDTIPFSFVLAVLQTMLEDPNRPTYHHTGQIKGYCRRNGYTIEPYDGRFGRGYRVHYPSAKASPGRHKVEYYIYTKEAQS